STSNSKPTLLFASVTSATNIDIFFSENLDQTTAQNTSNYSIDGGIGNPVSAVLDATNNALVHLTVSTLADFGTYDLTVSNLKDLTNLTMVTTTVSIYFNANPAQTPVVITEFMRDPSAVNDSEGEFLELYNLAGVPVNINGWILTDNAGETHTINNGSPLIILPNDFLILGLNGDVNSNGGISVDYVYSGFYLSNSGSGDQIILMNGSEIIDNVSFTTVSGFSNQTGKSNELIYFDGDNNVPENWQVSNSQLSSGDFASPKQKTHSVNVVVQVFGNDLILSWNAVSNATSYDVLEAGTETLVTNTANLTVTLVGEAINQSNKFYFVRAKQ
ncbi:lamin tail domain-containing protein, partial [bacterium]|nr:lamin tail domain-containing protein [bacterium]